ncbi:MAG: glycosyltransferase [Planctomycetota bacterium]|nr:glycosyltransferase [Planctomycetota bacterium]
MRIAILLDRWQPRGGGLEAWLRAATPALVARGHDVLLIARDAQVETPRGARAVPTGTVWPLPRPWRDRVDAHERVRAALRERADAVLDLRASQACGATWFAMGGFGADREGKPPSARRRALLRLEQESVRLAAAAVAPSPLVVRALHAFRPELEVAVLPLPLLEPVPEAQGPDADALSGRRPLRIVFCGRDPERHGLVAAAGWVKALRERYPRLEWRAWSRLGAKAPGARMRAWDGSFRAELARADLLVHPTAYDSFSLVCLEAAAAGVPVLTTAHAGAGELLPSELCAVAPREDPDAAAAAAATLLNAAAARSPVERARLRERIRSEYALDQHVDALASFLAAHPWSG